MNVLTSEQKLTCNQILRVVSSWDTSANFLCEMMWLCVDYIGVDEIEGERKDKAITHVA